MSKITDIFSETSQTDLDCGLTIIDDGAGYSVVDTAELQQWIEDHGASAINTPDGYTAFCDAVESIECTHNASGLELIEAVRKDRDDEAAEEVALELADALRIEFCERRKRWVDQDDDYDPTPTQFAAAYITACDWIVEAAKLVEGHRNNDEIADDIDPEALERLDDAFFKYQEHSIANEHDQGPEAHRLHRELREAAEAAGIDTSDD